MSGGTIIGGDLKKGKLDSRMGEEEKPLKRYIKREERKRAA